MKFEITSTDNYEIQELIKTYPCLAEFQLEIQKYETPIRVSAKDKNGNTIMYEYDCNVVYTPYINIDSIEDLIRLCEATEHKLVFKGRDKMIEIYDGYRE